MRGKANRTKVGKTAQGACKSIYGYRYSPETGKRELDEYQAMDVRQLFQRYAKTSSFSAVSQELNQARIPSFADGPWYPLTIRRQLLNESYTGRFIYRKTKRVRTRNAVKANSKNRQFFRNWGNNPEHEWSAIIGQKHRKESLLILRRKIIIGCRAVRSEIS